jgi:hypothetical protein
MEKEEEEEVWKHSREKKTKTIALGGAALLIALAGMMKKMIMKEKKAGIAEARAERLRMKKIAVR